MKRSTQDILKYGRRNGGEDIGQRVAKMGGGERGEGAGGVVEYEDEELDYVPRSIPTPRASWIHCRRCPSRPVLSIATNATN